MTSAYLALALRFAIALILILAFAGKVKDGPTRFSSQVDTYGVFPRKLSKPVAWSVLIIEPMLAGALILGGTSAGPAVAAAALFATFAYVGWRGRLGALGGADCGCLGASVKLRLTRVSTGANATVAVLAGSVAVIQVLSVVPLPPSDVAGMVFAWVAAAALCGLYWLLLFAASVADSMGTSSRPGRVPS